MNAPPAIERIVAVAGRNIVIRHYADIDPLIDAMTEAELRDEQIPYYGELWPASIGLARWLVTNRALATRSLLDLGCGAGLVGIAAALAGARVCLADYLSPALALAGENASRNGVGDIAVERLDWRSATWRRSFDLIAGSDVLYERRSHAPILSLLGRCLDGGGEAILSDPGRGTLPAFVEKAEQAGFVVARDTIALPDETGARAPVIQILMLRQGAGT
ncbi:MAG: methyltransferase domain-containing protein [Pseudomonadales bacterium]